MILSRQCRISTLIVVILIMISALFFVKQKHKTRRIKRMASIPNLRYFNASRSFSRSYYQDLLDLGFWDSDKYVDVTQPLPNATFITALSSDHVGEGLAMVNQLGYFFKGHKIIMYDIGMNAQQRSWFERACNVEVRDINLTIFGLNNNLLSYRWKPIIIATALKEFPIVFYVDSSTDIKEGIRLDKFIGNITMKPDEPNIYALCVTDHSAFAATDPGMYEFLFPQYNIQKPTMLEAGKVIYVRTKTTYELGLLWYVLCALEGECMSPTGSQLKCTWTPDRFNTYAGCHRFDQAALNLIMGGYPNFNQSKWGMSYFWTHYRQSAGSINTPIC